LTKFTLKIAFSTAGELVKEGSFHDIATKSSRLGRAIDRDFMLDCGTRSKSALAEIVA